MQILIETCLSILCDGELKGHFPLIQTTQLFSLQVFCYTELCFTDSTQAASFVSAEPGENVTLRCKIKEKSDPNVKSWVWYKQSAGQEPQEVAVKLTDKLPNTSSDKFKINQRFDLTIEHTNETDEGMYFCGTGDGNTIKFSKGTFLAMKGNNLPFYISLTYTSCAFLKKCTEILQCVYYIVQVSLSQTYQCSKLQYGGQFLQES
uniref:Ig-like domain-containing protein n=1 Tax=Pygocentrus nattereri TaxID=42514 RepID=A0AAR2JYU6_PYGNA